MSAKAGTSDIGTYIAAAGFFLVTPYGLGVILGERDWRLSITRPLAGVSAGLAVVVLVGLATTIHDRTGDTLPDRAAHSADA